VSHYFFRCFHHRTSSNQITKLAITQLQNYSKEK
jgi:hypothetical protein